VGCRRSTDPIAQPIRLEISAPSVGLVYYPDPADHTTQNCKYDITARAIGGKAGEVVQWNDAFVFVGPSAAYHYSPYEVGVWWGAFTITSGDTQQAHIVLAKGLNSGSTAINYAIAYTLPTGDQQVARFVVQCGFAQ
jgi:hypothetical protein